MKLATLEYADGDKQVFQQKLEDTLKYARVKHDPSRVDTDEMDVYPDAVHMQDRPVGLGVGASIPIRKPVWNKLREINNDAGWAYVTTSQAMWINLPGDPRDIDITSEKTNAESIIGGGNLVAYDMETETHIRLVAPYNTDTEFVGNFHTHPHLYWYPTAIRADGRIFKVTSGIDVYIPLLKRTELWMHKSLVTLLPNRPITWTIQDVLSK